jgi:hypothetical protein
MLRKRSNNSTAVFSTCGVKFFRGTLALLIAVLLSGYGVPPFALKAYAASGQPAWMDPAAPPTITLGDTPTTTPKGCQDTQITYQSYTNTDWSYNAIPRDITTSACMVQNGMGQIGGGYIKPGAGYAYPAAYGIYGGFSAVPNQHTALYTNSSGSSLGYYFGFVYNLGSVLEFKKVNVDSTVAALGYNIRPGFNIPVVKGDDGKPLRIQTTAYSTSGEWMIAEVAGTGIMRINTLTGAMQLISTEYATYDMGYGPQMNLAISNDGMYAFKSGIYVGNTTVYDLTGCAGNTFHMGNTNPATATAGCKSRSLQQQLDAKLAYAGSSLLAMQFDSSANVIMGTALYQTKVGTIWVQHKNYITFTAAGYTPPKADYLAMGDSFSSGEGAYDYEQGTDVHEKPSNLCHLSKNSYPYLLGADTQASGGEFHSVACSGARIKNIIDSSNEGTQYPKPATDKHSEWLPGYQNQKAYVTGSPSYITLTIGGNDAGFADKLAECATSAIGVPLLNTCEYAKDASKQYTAMEIANLYYKLRATYRDVAAATNGQTKIYVVGYPQIVDPKGWCEDNTHLNDQERAYVYQATHYADQVIKAAAEDAGVYYLDIEHSLDGKNLCSGASNVVVNGTTNGDDKINVPVVLTANGDVVAAGTVGIGNESYHPKEEGQRLMAEAIRTATNNSPATFTVCPNNTDGTQICPRGAKKIPLPDEAYFGNTAVQYVNLKNGQQSNIHLASVPEKQSIVAETDNPAPRAITVGTTNLKPGTQVTVSIHSTPTELGTFTVSADGSFSTTVSIPDNIPAGYHTIHITGQNIAGEPIDYYQTVIVSGPADDVDGDGIPNSTDPCSFLDASGTDVDQDGIDDACDGTIGEAPAVDTTAPAVTGTITEQPSQDGWYNHDVTITWQATDPTTDTTGKTIPSSGIAAQPEVTVAATEGEHEYTSPSVCDNAGNCATGSKTLKIDKTTPTIDFALSPQPNQAGWNTDDSVTVTFICEDTVSGVASCPDPVTVSGNDGIYAVSGTAINKAGNSNGVNVFVSLDRTKPIITAETTPAANEAGWRNTDVSVSFTCTDATSGIADCTAPVTFANEGAAQRVDGTATDVANNSASTTVSDINIDKTAPVLGAFTWSGAGSVKALSESSTLTFPVSDGLSGVAGGEYFIGNADPGVGNGATVTVANGTVAIHTGTDYPTGVFKLTIRIKDNAGNWSSISSDYLVVYDPAQDSLRMTGKRAVIPSLGNGDVLPGLIAPGQNDKATFGFSVRYDKNGQINRNSDMQLEYETGTKCSAKDKTKAINCHHLGLNAATIEWFTTQGDNNSTGIFQGTGLLNVDGQTTTVRFRITGVDGERLSSDAKDLVGIQIFPLEANPNTSTSTYQIHVRDIARGNIRVR